MVTYVFTHEGGDDSYDFDTIVDAFAAARADMESGGGIVPKSIDDHEGNLYDAVTIDRQLNRRSRLG